MQLDQELLQQALLEVEHLRQLEIRSRTNAESLLVGLELLSSAHSQKDSVLAILSVLTSIIDFDAAVVLCEVEPGKVISLAEIDPSLRVENGQTSGALSRAFRGKPVVFSNANSSDWSQALGCDHYKEFNSVALLPVAPVDFPTLIVCLHRDGAKYAKSDHERIRHFVPLAAHAIRHSFKLAELRRVVAELDEARSEAEVSARTDPLTGLANRTRLEEQIETLLANHQVCCFALIDLNGFKPINDNYGHHAGDHVLVEVGARLRQVLGPEALVARIGGDEFGVVMTGNTSPETMQDLGQKLCTAFQDPVILKPYKFDIGASIGIATTGDSDQSAENVLLLADAAMYSVKAARKTGFAIGHHPSGEADNTVITHKSVSAALSQGEIIPFYQPQIDVKTGEMVGLEVLARWRHPDQGIIAPDAFIPEIERGGLSGRFTCMILRSAMEQCRAWMRSGLTVPDIAVNIAEANLTSFSAAEELLDIFFQYPEMLGKVVFEITEGVFLGRSSGHTFETLDKLVKAGVRISLDDFGTGFATFASLSIIPFHELKVDRSFVAAIGLHRKKEVIIEAIVSIAHAHGARVVAEGVETNAQFDFLERIGCEVVQGYLLGKPTQAMHIGARLMQPKTTEKRQLTS